MNSWYFFREYPNHLIEADMKKVKQTPKNRNTKRGKSLKPVPFVLTYHLKVKLMSKVVPKYLDVFYMDKEVKRVFTSKPMISFRSARKQSSYLVRVKLYPTERTEGSYKRGAKRCEVCIIVNETTFTSTVTKETYIKNHRFDCNERYSVYFLTCSKCKMQYVGQTSDQFWSRWNNCKSDSIMHCLGATCMQQHLFNDFCTSDHCRS